jgi:hypothetical protein
MNQNQRNYYKKNIVALNLTAALIKKNPEDDTDDEVKWPCLETTSAKDSSTETSSTTSRDATSNASDQKRKPYCTIGMGLTKLTVDFSKSIICMQFFCRPFTFCTFRNIPENYCTIFVRID